MAENTDDSSQQIAVPTEEQDGDVQEFCTELQSIWDTAICKFVQNLSEKEVLEEKHARKAQFCCCVNKFIRAYEGKAREVVRLRNNLEVLKNMYKEERRKTTQLKIHVSKLHKKLASTVCDDCGEKRIAEVSEQLDALTVETRMESSGSTETEVDGSLMGRNVNRHERKRPREIDEESFESDSNSDERSPRPLMQDLRRCKYASCGLDALLIVLHKREIYFCPTKLSQKLGRVIRHEKPTCTKILNHIHDLHFVKRVYKCEEIDAGGHDEVLKTAANELINSNEKFGIMTYSTAEYNHSMAVHIKKRRLKIYDMNDRNRFFYDLKEVCYIELVVLSCNEQGEPKIKRWADECHLDACVKERVELPRPGNKEKSSLSDVVFEDETPEVEGL